MFQIPDAPYIREAERRGTDYMYEFLGYEDGEEEFEEYEEEEENDDF